MKNRNIGRTGLLLKSRNKKFIAQKLSADEEKRKKSAEATDIESLLRNNGRAVTDETESFLSPPENVKKVLSKSLFAAKIPPRIEFAVIPYQYRYFPQLPEDRKIGPWSSWGQACYYSKQDKFFGAAGDHGWYNPNLHIVEYDCIKRRAKCLSEINTVLGRKPQQFGEAKIHGYPDVYKAPYLENEHLWFCTYWCRYPEPSEDDFESGYSGGHIMSYDLHKDSYVDYGVPLKRASWPYHRVDRKRGMLYAVGMFGEFLAWDIDNERIQWAGYPPSGMKWFNRCLLLDEESGMVYSNNSLSNSQNILNYDPHRNRFTEMGMKMPKNRQYKTIVPMRCHTRRRDSRGKFWGLTALGDLFSFDPAGEVFEEKKRLWPLNDAYSVTMDQSPGGRYLYFGIASHGRGYPYGSPILQHDLFTDTTKIIAFLHPYYYEKYGYISGGSYSFKLDEKGEKLFMIWNGDFNSLEKLEAAWRNYNADEIKNWSVPSSHDAFGHCSTYLVHIPAEERRE
jgi:hypothetical protein